MNYNGTKKSKIEYSDVIDDKDDIIGGRREEDSQILQPIWHLSGTYISNVKLKCSFIFNSSLGDLLGKMGKKC